jgi:hypothetical protein
MQTSRLRAALLALSWAAFLLPSRLYGQAVTGVGDDATMPKRGELRFSASSVWNRWYERYGQGTQGTLGRPNGSVEPLGVDFNFDSLGLGQLENLAPVQSSIRSLAGMPSFTASLGTSQVLLHDNVSTAPLGLELGLTNRLSLSVMVPFVTATSNVNFVMNPTGHEPTLGFNPTLHAPGALSADSAIFAQFAGAAAQMSSAITQCAAAPSGAGCAQINANTANARALIANANTYAASLAQVYGGRGSSGFLFVPIAGTAAQTAIEARIAAYRAQYASYGVSTITSTGPVAAQAPLTASDMQTVLSDPTYGINAKPLATSITRGLGDVEVALKLNLFDSFHGNDSARFAPKGFQWRQTVGATYRLGTGVLPSPADLTAIGTGTHTSAIEVRTFTDLLYGPHFWVSVVAGVTSQTADQIAARIPDAPSQVILASYRQETVQRHLGSTVDIQINPRWNLNDYLALSGQYYYRHKSADVYSGTFSVLDLNGNNVTLNAAVLGMYTEASESRMGVGATYSTVATVAKKKSGVAFDISYFHYETTLGSLGRVPKIAVDQVTLRIYQRLFGR